VISRRVVAAKHLDDAARFAGQRQSQGDLFALARLQTQATELTVKVVARFLDEEYPLDALNRLLEWPTVPLRRRCTRIEHWSPIPTAVFEIGERHVVDWPHQQVGLLELVHDEEAKTVVALDQERPVVQRRRRLGSEGGQALEMHDVLPD